MIFSRDADHPFALNCSKARTCLLSALIWASACVCVALGAQNPASSLSPAPAEPTVTTLPNLPNMPAAPVSKNQGNTTAQKATRSMLILGDSLSAEYGLIKGQGWVALMQERIKQEHLPWSVINASISGETTSGGLARLPSLLATHHPQLVVIELGANDALRGLDLKTTQSNLLQMAQLIKNSKAKVFLMGIQVPPNYGQQYNDDLKATFATVAQKTQSAFLPFFFQGLLDHLAQTHENPQQSDAWFQADRIHPLAKAHPFILQGIWPTLQKNLKDQN